MRATLAAALAVAAASLALPFQPVYDPWGWLVWGRELVQGGLDTSAGPSWKPLPVLTCAPLSLLGESAPKAWLLIARTGWVLAPLLAGLLAARLSGPATGRWRLAAALLAAGSVALTGDSFTPPLRQFTGGLSEPLLVALVLAATWAALDDRPGVVLALGAAAALLRPECWPFLALWAVLAARREPRLRVATIAVGVLIPVAWFVPDVVGAGTPLEGSETARDGGIELLDGLETIGRALAAPLAAAWVGLALLLVGARGRLERPLAILLAGALAWLLLVAAMAVVGFAGLPRFLAPATAVIAVLGGVGLSRASAAAFGRSGRGDGSSCALCPHGGHKAQLDLRATPRPVLRAAVAATIALGFGGLALRVADVPDDLDTVERQTRSLEDLFEVAEATGGERLLACGGTVRVTQLLSQTALAWRLDEPISAVRVRKPPLFGIALSTRPLPGGVRIAQAGGWRATRLPCPSGYRDASRDLDADSPDAHPPRSSASARAIAGVSGALR